MNDTPTPRPFGCKCTDLAHHVAGDGCSECNPKLHAELLAEQLQELELERELAAERALADRLAFHVGNLHDEFRLPEDMAQGSYDALAAWKASRDPNNLEGPGPSEDERRENARAIQAMSEPDRFALMFGKTETKDD